jgi:prepilin-type N-terminal cleavage/methylation domain-containing protein
VSPLARIRTRLRAERGFTLIELLVAIALGGIVVTAAINVMEASVRASNDSVNRMDGLQKGRLMLEEVSQRLRAQVCPDKATPAIVDATASSLTFYTELSAAQPNGIPNFAPEGRRISFTSNKVVEEVWNSLASPFANTFNAAPSFTRVLADDIYPHAGRPFFRYFTFINNPATPDLELVPPISAADKARIVKIDVTFDSRPSSLNAQSNRIDTSLQSEVFVRTADPTDPEHSPLCD